MANVVGRLNVLVGAQTTGLTKGLKQAETDVQRFAGKAAGWGRSIAAGLGIGLGIEGARRLAATVSSTVDEFDRLFSVASRTGTKTSTLAGLQQMAENANLSAESVTTALTKFQKVLSTASGGGAGKSAFAALGLDASQLKGVSMDEALGKVADALKAIPNPADRARVAIELFGRSGAEMLTIFEGGSAAIEEMAAHFKQMDSQTFQASIKEADKVLEEFAMHAKLFKAWWVREFALPVIQGTNQVIRNLQGNPVTAEEVFGPAQSVMQPLTMPDRPFNTPRNVGTANTIASDQLRGFGGIGELGLFGINQSALETGRRGTVTQTASSGSVFGSDFMGQLLAVGLQGAQQAAGGRISGALSSGLLRGSAGSIAAINQGGRKNVDDQILDTNKDELAALNRIVTLLEDPRAGLLLAEPPN